METEQQARSIGFRLKKGPAGMQLQRMISGEKLQVTKRSQG